MKDKKMNKKAAGFVQEHLGEILIGLAVIVLMVTVSVILKNKDFSIIQAVENFFRSRA